MFGIKMTTTKATQFKRIKNRSENRNRDFTEPNVNGQCTSIQPDDDKKRFFFIAKEVTKLRQWLN